MYMGGGGDAGSIWAYTSEIAAGEWSQITFTVTDGVICGYVNGVRSGDCSDVDPGGSKGTMEDGNRQMGHGTPLEVGAGLGRIALHHRSSTLHQICSETRCKCLCF
jgi:hypothetical protein